jgi:GTP cyclohydrolase IA
MKFNGKNNDKEKILRLDDLGDMHIGNPSETPLREDAFEMDDETKIKLIEKNFREIMLIMGLDLNDDSLKDTPHRVAKMFIKEIFSGLNPANSPRSTLFENSYQYNQMLLEKNISFYSTCEHHFLPIKGKAHVAYISSGKVIGLSKIHRIVHYLSKRPQVQERLTRQIAEEMKNVLKTEDVAVVLEAHHLCVSARGIRDEDSLTVTSEFCGQFSNGNMKKQLFAYLKK